MLKQCLRKQTAFDFTKLISRDLNLTKSLCSFYVLIHLTFSFYIFDSFNKAVF